MRLQLATSLLAASGRAVFASVVDAKRVVASASHVPPARGEQHALNTDHQGIRTRRGEGGGGRRAKRQQLRRQVRRIKATNADIRNRLSKEGKDIDQLLKVEEDQQGGEDVGILSNNPSPPRFLQDRDFCECVEYGYAVEEEQCFDTAVAGCKLEGPYVDSPPTGCGGPYIASYCQYYECLDDTFGSFDAFQAASNEDQQACMCSYYASVCYMCTPGEDGRDPIIDPDDDFCESSDTYCQIATCCEEAQDAGGKSACIDDLLDERDDSDGPTFEPTMEAPDVGINSVEPTSSPTRKAGDTPVPTAGVTVVQPTPEEIAPSTSVPTEVIITSSPTEDDDTTSSPTSVPDIPTLIPTAQPTEVVEGSADAPTERMGGEATPSPEPTLPESPPSTSAASLVTGRRHAASGVCLAIALAGCISFVF